MTRKALRWSIQARRDVAAIRAYLKTAAGPIISAQVVERLLAVTRALREAPLAWEARPEWGEGRRRALSKPYVVIFRVRNEIIEIERVVHGARDLPALLLGDDNPV